MNVTILGVGATGRRVARACAVAGNAVSIHADHPSDAMDAIDSVEHHFEKQGTQHGKLDATTELRAAVRGADIVIETVTSEDAAINELFAEIEEVVGPETVFATSTPTISITAAADGLSHPSRVIGLRFHTDANLVEIVGTDQTSLDVIELASSFVEELGAVPLFVQDTPGMVSERLIAALEVEAIRLLDAGIAGVDTIDELLVTGYDHPIGPLERADRVGLDARLELLQYLSTTVGEQYQPPDLLEQRVAVGKTGAAAGEGFFIWEHGDPIRPAIDGPGAGFDSSHM